MVVYGPSYVDDRGPLTSSAYHVVTNEKDFLTENNRNTNYWSTEIAGTGEDARLYMAFACPTTIRGFKIKNTHNARWNNVGTNQFKILTSTTDSGPWTVILSENIPDARNVDPVPVLQFPLENSVTTQYIMFQIETYYGTGGGLQYFATY